METPTADAGGRTRSRALAVAFASVACVVVAVAVWRLVGSSKNDSNDGANRMTRDGGAVNDGEVERLRARVVRRYPHQRDAFTQGLLWDDGVIFESTGRVGSSSLRMVELETGEVLRRRENDPGHFAEGLARAGDLLVQLTWQDGKALVYRVADFEPVREHTYDGEGWGLCYDGTSLVMSDGTDELTFRDPETFAATRTVSVTLDGKPATRLNELECVDGAVWANIWKEDAIVRIDPRDGRITAVVDARGLLTGEERRGTDVLNGIAWMPEVGHFLITGKLWPWMFEVEFAPDPPR